MGRASQRKQQRRDVRCSNEQRTSAPASNADRLHSDRTASRKALGTVAKTVSTQRTGGGGGFRNSAGSSGRRVNHKRRKHFTPEQQAAARVRRFALQSEAGRILPGERVSRCLRRRVPVAHSVDVQYVPDTSSAHFAGLQVCSSVWACPCCAAVISEKRRDELAGLISKHLAAHGSVYMTTYTIRHGKFDELAPMLARFLAARRRMRQGRRGVALRKQHNIIGTVSVLEVTWSEVNGWHPHVHELVFCADAEMDTASYERAARSAWEDAAAAFDLDMNEHGFELQRTYGAVADYIAKYGREPATEKPWGVESEMVKGHLKAGRGEQHFTPFALLAAVHDGRAELAPKFREYALAFKGRKQLTFSPGLKARYQEEEKTDEELLAEHEHKAVNLIELDDEQWDQVIGNDIRGELLESARSGRPGLVLALLEEFGVKLYPEQYSRFEHWQVQSPGGAGRVLSVQYCEILKRWRASIIFDQATVLGNKWQAYDLVELQMVSDLADGSSDTTP